MANPNYDEDDVRRRRRQSRHIDYGDMTQVRFYEVDGQLNDEEMRLPPIPRKPLRSITLNSDKPYLRRHEQLIDTLSLVSPIPKYVLRSYWPWRLAAEIRAGLESIPSLEGLRSNLPSDGDQGPTQFAYWMAANMPLKETEKLDLLKMDSTVQRLTFILDKVLLLEQQETFVCCKVCGAQLSTVADVFTVGGADGTSGAYGK